MEKSEATGILNTKTHRRLRKAYCSLIRKMKAEKITVSALTEEADVSRATFYTYFQNIEEFKDYALRYILALFIKQIGDFLIAGKQGVKEACRRRNLIFHDDDFELFCCLFENEKGFGYDKSILNFALKSYLDNIGSYFDEKFLKKNHDRLDLFYIGYTAVMRVDFLDYHSDKVYRDVMRTIHIWENLFPKYKSDF